MTVLVVLVLVEAVVVVSVFGVVVVVVVNAVLFGSSQQPLSLNLWRFFLGRFNEGDSGRVPTSALLLFPVYPTPRLPLIVVYSEHAGRMPIYCGGP